MTTEQLLVSVLILSIVGIFFILRKRKPIHIQYSENLAIQSMQPILGNRVLCIGMDGTPACMMSKRTDTITQQCATQ